MTQSTTQEGSSRALIHSAMPEGSPVTVRNLAKMSAPATIMKTMQEMRRVARIAPWSFFQESLPRRVLMTTARKLATAAASVAVTSPVKRAYMMTPKSTRMSSASGKARKRSRQVLLGPAGPQSG